MKILYSWLKEFIDIECSPQELAEKLENLGIEVASVTPLGKGLEKVVVGEILESKPHPNADRLSVCTVSDGQGKRQIVCGAKNFKVGDKAPLALPEASLPNGVKIALAKLRGVESQGMLCSEEELGLPKIGTINQGPGIMILEKEIPTGVPFAKAIGWDDTVLEIEITPNRGDLLSHLGLARELACAWQKPLRLPTFPNASNAASFPVSIEAQDLCSRYTARVLEGAAIGPSPWLIALRLFACGTRPISNAVDITNYVLLETGQPLHVFDSDKLEGRQIKIRMARAGEKLLALDGKTYLLTPEMLVIADAAKPVALAGVMGGEESAVTAGTKNILLESALFDPVTVRRTSRRLGLISESSYRFERGVDPEGVLLASARASALLQKQCQAKEAGFTDQNVRPWKPISISIDPSRLNRRLGTSLSDHEIAKLLTPLGATQKRGEALVFTAPSYRPDLLQEHDLLEETARFHGYENIPLTYPPMPILAKTVNPLWTLEREISRLLMGWGFFETMHYSFLSEASAKEWGYDPKDLIPVENPLSADWTYLRPSLVPSLLSTVMKNWHRQRVGIRLFERGKVFAWQGLEFRERTMLGIAIFGVAHEPDWHEKAKSTDFYTVSGLAEALLTAFKIPSVSTGKTTHPIWDPEVSWEYQVNGEFLGMAGQLKNKGESGDLPTPAFFLEWDLEVLSRHRPLEKHHKPTSNFPAVHRDLSVVIPRDIFWSRVQDAIQKSGGDLLEEVRLFDVYRGANLLETQQSLTFALRFRSQRETLTDKTVDKLQEDIVETLQKGFGAALRSA